MQEKLCSEMTDAVICCFYTVYNILGKGFLEKVYENALAVELAARGILSQQQVAIQVIYKHVSVGQYVCDLLVNNKVIVEVKAVKTLLPEHDAQLLNYLKATGIEVGLLLNFGAEPEIRRKIFTNHAIGPTADNSR